MFGGEADELIVIAEQHVQAGDHVTATPDGRAHVRPPRLREAPANRRNADCECVTRRRVGHLCDDWGVLNVREMVTHPLARSLAVEHRHDIVVGVSEHAHGCLRVVGKLPVGQKRQPHTRSPGALPVKPSATGRLLTRAAGPVGARLAA